MENVKLIEEVKTNIDKIKESFETYKKIQNNKINKNLSLLIGYYAINKDNTAVIKVVDVKNGVLICNKIKSDFNNHEIKNSFKRFDCKYSFDFLYDNFIFCIDSEIIYKNIVKIIYKRLKEY